MNYMHTKSNTRLMSQVENRCVNESRKGVSKSNLFLIHTVDYFATYAGLAMAYFMVNVTYSQLARKHESLLSNLYTIS